MKIILTNHAKYRMQERKISKSEVVAAILSPDKEGKHDGKSVAMKVRNNMHLLIVYYVTDKMLIRVITVITTSKISKYFK